MDERDGRIAFVGERSELEDAFRLTGLFDVHWETLEGDEAGNGPRGVSVDEAVTWGRQHASYVSVRLGDSDSDYSAGELDLNDLDGSDDADDEPSLPWPPEGMVVRSRPYGTPHDGSVQEADWLIETNATDLPAHGEEELARVRALLERHDQLRGLELTRSGKRRGIRRVFPARGGGPGVRLRCIVRARSAEPAMLEADRVFEEALAEVFPGHDRAGDSTGSLGPVSSVPGA